MHATTKLTAITRKEIFSQWKKGTISLRALGRKYHVDKKVIQRIIARGQHGDFQVHTSVNIRYLPGARKRKKPSPVKRRPAKTTTHRAK